MTTIELTLVIFATVGLLVWMFLVLCALCSVTEHLLEIVQLLEERRPKPTLDVTSSPHTAKTGFTHHIPRQP